MCLPARSRLSVQGGVGVFLFGFLSGARILSLRIRFQFFKLHKRKPPAAAWKASQFRGSGLADEKHRCHFMMSA